MIAVSTPTHPLDLLNDEDYAELSQFFSDSQLVKLGHFSVVCAKQGGKQIGIKHRGLVFRYLDPSSGLPYLNSKGKPFYRMKPRDWAESWDDPTEPPPKYLSQRDEGNKPYFSPLLQHFNRLAKKPSIDLDITEGEKKSDALSANGIFSVGLAGVYGWLDRSARLDEIDIPPAQIIEDDEEAIDSLDDKLPKSRMIPELRDAIEWQHRRVNIVFDSDCGKRQVRGAMKDLAEALLELGAEPHIIRLPNEIDGSKNGVDDFLRRHGLEAYNFLKKIAKSAFKKKKFHFPAEPTLFEKIIMAWSVLKDSWRFRPGVGWYEFVGTHWVNRTNSEFQEAVTIFQDAQLWEFPVGKDLMCYQLQSRMLVRDDRWNPTHLLAFANGVLSVKSNTFTEGHNHEDFLTVVLPYEYSPLATCTRWIKFLNEALNGDQEGIALLQAFIKWILLPKPRNKKAEIEKCLDLMGSKGSGKGTFLDVLIALVGSENIGAIGSKTFESSTHLADLLDKKLSVDSDAFGFLSNVGLFNKVVSNEPVSIKRLYKDPVTTRLGTVIVRAYNRFLEVPDGSEGLDRRIIAIHFNNKPTDIDVELSEKLQAELPGIFTWAWSLTNSEMKRRIMWAGSVESVASASIQRFEANNPEYSFLRLTFPNGNPMAKASDLYHSYQLWCKDDAGISPKKRRKFSEALQALGCEHKRTNEGYFYSIPSMDEFDVVKFLGLSKKITRPESFGAENVHNVHPTAGTTEKPIVPAVNILKTGERSNVHSTPENVHFEENDGIKYASPPPFDVGDRFVWWGEQLQVERVGTSTLYCHVADGTPEQNTSFVRVPFDEAEKIKNQPNEHSYPLGEHSNVHHPDRMFTAETLSGQGFQGSGEHCEHSRPQTSLGEEVFSEATTPTSQSWTKSVFAAIKEREVELEFPYLGCEVNKIVDGQRKPSWNGYIRLIEGELVKVWWINDWQTNRAGKPIKGGDGLLLEKWSLCKLSEICPRPAEESQKAKRHPETEARNQSYLDQARRKQNHCLRLAPEELLDQELLNFQPAKTNVELMNEDIEEMAESGFDHIPAEMPEPYHPKTNPPKKGDRVRQNCGTVKLGRISETRAKNPRYQITWDDGQQMDLTFELIEDLDIRRVN